MCVYVCGYSINLLIQLSLSGSAWFQYHSQNWTSGSQLHVRSKFYRLLVSFYECIPVSVFIKATARNIKPAVVAWSLRVFGVWALHQFSVFATSQWVRINQRPWTRHVLTLYVIFTTKSSYDVILRCTHVYLSGLAAVNGQWSTGFTMCQVLRGTEAQSITTTTAKRLKQEGLCFEIPRWLCIKVTKRDL